MYPFGDDDFDEEEDDYNYSSSYKGDSGFSWNSARGIPDKGSAEGPGILKDLKGEPLKTGIKAGLAGIIGEWLGFHI